MSKVALIVDTRTVHTVPVGDLYPHVESATCPCGPDLRRWRDGWGGEGSAIVHNAWDRREYAEGEWNLDKVPYVRRTEVM